VRARYIDLAGVSFRAEAELAETRMFGVRVADDGARWGARVATRPRHLSKGPKPPIQGGFVVQAFEAVPARHPRPHRWAGRTTHREIEGDTTGPAA
jgi:hypothetical protein